MAQEGSPQSVDLTSIDLKQLESVNIKLLVRDGSPKVSAARAEEVVNASGNPFGLPVREVALARLAQDGPNGLGRDELVWVVVLSDGTERQMLLPGPAQDRGTDRKPVTYSYAVSLVDANSEELAFTQFGPPYGPEAVKQ